MKLTSTWLLPISGPPVANGVVHVSDDRITAITPRGDGPAEDVIDLGNAVMMPGLVNAHTHLELSYLRGRINPPADLVEWLMGVLAHQQVLSERELETLTAHAVQRGVQESLAAGVTTLGDVSRFCHLTRPLLRRGPLRVVSFGEVLGIGTRRHLIGDRLRVAAESSHQSPYLTVGLSPHAPYSIEGPAASRVLEHARLNDMPVCMHLAESVEEIQFLQTGQGRFREMLETLGLWDQQIEVSGLTPVRWAKHWDLLGPGCLMAHGNYLDDEEMDLLCATGAHIAYCPATHRYFKHQRHPLLKLMGSGVNVCVATDSLGSSPSLSVLSELQMVRRLFPELSPRVILSLGTINAARALGMAHKIGSLEPGKQADIAVFRLADEHDDPESVLLDEPVELAGVYIAGLKQSI